MSWDCLSAEVASMFAGYTTREHDRQMSLEWWVGQQRAKRAEYERDPFRKRKVKAARLKWRKQNPEAEKSSHRERVKRYRARHKERYMAGKRKREKAYREKHKERLRVYWRERKRALRAAKKEAA